jgi:hypothetical protein
MEQYFVSLFGTLCGLFLKDFLFVHYFDNLRERKTLAKVSKKYKDPILLSALEITSRLNDYIENYSFWCKYSTIDTLFDKIDKTQTNYITDPYFLNYKIISTLYRFCSFFAWLELYRQEITFLDSHSKGSSSKSLTLIANIREAIADGQLIKYDDWDSWTDALIFREELRAIGEGMIEKDKDQRNIIGYGKFRTLISQYEKTREPLWLNPAINFFMNLKLKKKILDLNVLK